MKIIFTHNVTDIYFSSNRRNLCYCSENPTQIIRNTYNNMIELMVKNGLGNQMFQYAYARYIQECYKKMGKMKILY